MQCRNKYAPTRLWGAAGVSVVGIGMLLTVGSCANTGNAGANVGGPSGSAAMSGGAGGTGGGAAGTGGGTGGQAPDIVRKCAGAVYECGDGMDNDGDGLSDAADPDCYGPCHNSEAWFYPFVPDNYFDLCTRDCYYDNNSGPGNDGCYWDHRCDSHALPPTYDPAGKATCQYEPSTLIWTNQGPSTCNEAKQSQSTACLGVCGPLTPNGCDCFGCCELVPGSFRWLGSTNDQQEPTCSASALNDPSKCRPCDPVPSCMNPCDACESCIGGKLPAAGCTLADQCPSGVQPCGVAGQPYCPADAYCVTGCCRPIP